jgi:hypothetical protein
MKKPLDVAKGKDLVTLSLTGHTYVRLLDAKGDEVFRSASPAESVTAVVQPGSYTVETDGKLAKYEVGSLESLGPHLGARAAVDATKPPEPKT